jgi:YhcH/YjgK/YiaL family protein
MRRRDVVSSLVAGGLLPRLALAANREALTARLDQWKGLAGTKGLEPAFEFLSKLDSASVTPGRTPIVGDEVYAVASKYASKAVETARFEVHKKFLDVQYVVSGQETIGFLPSAEGLTVFEPYDAEKDIAFFAAPASYSSLAVRAGHFAVFRPGEGHMPGCHLDGRHDVVKVVVKVSAAWYVARIA